MGHDPDSSGLRAAHDHQIVVDVFRKAHWVEWTGGLPRRGHEKLLRLDARWKQEGGRACKPSDDEPAAANLRCGNQHDPDPLRVRFNAQLRDSSEPRHRRAASPRA
jgi:hypothetical protein